MLKTYQFKTQCKGDIHSSKTANIILSRLMIKQRWTSLRLQAKYSRLRLFNLGEMSCFNQHNEFEYHFACSRKGWQVGSGKKPDIPLPFFPHSLPFPFPPSRPLPSIPSPSFSLPPLRSRPLKSTYGVLGIAVNWCIMALKSVIWLLRVNWPNFVHFKQ